ncbi:MAG: glycosyltransferase family 4 protein, partial [Bacteroidota bacterium]
MKILVFTDWFLPGTQAGGPTQSLISMMNNFQGEFFVITRNTDHGSITPYDLETNKWIRHRSNIQIIYFDESEINRNSIEKIIKDIEPNWIYLNSLWSPIFTLLPLKVAKKLNISHRVICAPRGMLKPEALKIKRWKKSFFLIYSKFISLYSNILWHATSDIEKKEIQIHFGNSSRIRISANLANLEISHLQSKEKKAQSLNILTVARVSSEKGILEAAQILKRWNKPVNWSIIGLLQDKDLVAQVNTVLKNTLIKHTWQGHLSKENIKPFYRNHHIFFLPTKGENFGHAIAEALSEGLPVIISDATPWKNLEQYQAGYDLSVANGNFNEVLESYFQMSDVDLFNCSQN